VKGVEIPSFEEFKNLPTETQADILKKLRKEYKSVKIIDKWNISRATFYTLLHNLNVPLKEDDENQDTSENLSNFSITFNGIYNSKDVVDKISKLIEIIKNENKNYYVKLEIREL
jgi:hypothetical protein